MKKLHGIILLALLLAITLSVSAWAYPVPINYKMKLADLEFFNAGVTPAVGPFADGIEDNWGVANITDIFDLDLGPFADAVWSAGDNGEHIRLIFYGLDITSWAGDPGGFTTGPANVTVGGMPIPVVGLDLWLWDEDLAGYVDFVDAGPGARVAYDTYPTVSGSNAGLQGSFLFAPGIDAIGSLTDGNTYGTSSPPTGQGAGYLDAIPGSGALADLVNTDGFSVPPFGNRDIFFQFNFRVPGMGDPVTEFQLYSEDPILGSAIPEPGTMLLLGSGLIGLAGFGRRKFFKKSVKSA